MDVFISKHLNYPEQAIVNKTEGSVAVDYTVDVFGNVKEVKIKHGIGDGCDEEAIRLVKLLKYEKKKYHGLHVVFHKSLIINFHLNAPSQNIAPAELKINYHLIEDENPFTEAKIVYTIIPEKKK